MARSVPSAIEDVRFWSLSVNRKVGGRGAVKLRSGGIVPTVEFALRPGVGRLKLL